ncbi:MAG: AI-2E family transporter [Myxococcota bacterium]
MDSESGEETQPQNVEAPATAGQFFHEVHVIRGAILVLAIGVGLAVLKYASVVLIPVTLAIFLAYVLNPFVKWLMKARLPGTEYTMPRGFASFLVVVVAFALTVSLGIVIGDQFKDFAAELVRYEDQIAENVSNLQESVQNLQSRFEEYLQPIRGEGQVVEDSEASPLIGEGATPEPESSSNNGAGKSSFFEQTSEIWVRVSGFVAGGITGLLGFLAQVLTVIFVLYFALLEAPNIRAKVIHIMGTTPERRRLTIEVLENVNRDVQRYLFNRFATNSVLGGMAMLAYYVYGMKYVLLLGVLAGLFNFVPYVGPAVGSIFPALIAYIQFGTIESVFWVLVIYGTLTGIEGNFVTPLVLGRHLRLNSLAVMLGLVFWGWLWGAIGMFLAIPILAGVKAVSEHVEDMQPIGELLRG